MHFHFVEILLIVIFTVLAWWVNEKINPPQPIKNIIQVIIVVAAVFFLLQSIGIFHSNISVSA